MWRDFSFVFNIQAKTYLLRLLPWLPLIFVFKDKSDFKKQKVLFDLFDPEDNDYHVLYSNWACLILLKTAQQSKNCNSRKKIRQFWLNAK